MDNQEKYSFSFISFDAHQPPVIFEKKNVDWIIFGDGEGYVNNYPQYLQDNYDKSPTHAAIVNGKINYVVGNGLEVSYYSDVPSLALAKATIRSVNQYEDADDLNRKLSTDLIMFGGFYVELIQTKDGKGISANHLSFNNIRRSKDDENVWYYTSDWTTRKPQQNEDFKVFESYDHEKGFGNGNYLVDYSIYRSGNEPYALPDYLAANGYIELDWRIGNYLLQNVKNGFSAGFLINFYNGHPEPEQKREIEKQIKKKFGGDNAGGSFVLNFNDPDSKNAEIIPIPTNGHDDRFNTLKEAVRDNLFTSHNVTSPMLFGVKVAGQLGGRTEMVEAFELMQNTYTANRQRIIEKFWNDLLYFKGANSKIEIIEATPIKERLSDDIRISVMTQDEIRDELGLPALEGAPLAQNTKFSDERDNVILDHFETCGFSEDELEEVYSRSILAKDIEEAMQFAEVTTFENSVLALLVDNPTLPPAEIAKALNTTPEKVMDALKVLEDEKYITLDNGEVEVTKSGVDNSEDSEVFVVYKYALRPGMSGGDIIPTSRDFCKRLIRADKNYTIEDIARLKNGQGLDVFTHRGGWYTRPNTNIRIPYCRHTWKLRLVKLKK